MEEFCQKFSVKNNGIKLNVGGQLKCLFIINNWLRSKRRCWYAVCCITNIHLLCHRSNANGEKLYDIILPVFNWESKIITCPQQWWLVHTKEMERFRVNFIFTPHERLIRCWTHCICFFCNCVDVGCFYYGVWDYWMLEVQLLDHLIQRYHFVLRCNQIILLLMCVNVNDTGWYTLRWWWATYWNIVYEMEP